MKKRFLMLLLLTKIYAGDACPLQLDIYNAGVPSWLDEKKVLKNLDFNFPRVGIYTDETSDGRIEIEDIAEDSVANIVDLRPNDIIEKIDDLLIKEDKDITIAINKHRGGELITFHLLRHKKKLVKTFRVGVRHQDPLVAALRLSARDVDCAYVHNEALTKKERKKVEAAVFEKFKRFDCKNAHKRLAKLKIRDFTYSEEATVIMRGSKRILLSFIGHKTMCLNSDDYKGDKLTQKKVDKLFSELYDNHIDYRIENP